MFPVSHELPCPQLTVSKPLACSFSQAYHCIPLSWVCFLGMLGQGESSLGEKDDKESEVGGVGEVREEPGGLQAWVYMAYRI